MPIFRLNINKTYEVEADDEGDVFMKLEEQFIQDNIYPVDEFWDNLKVMTDTDTLSDEDIESIINEQRVRE